MEIITKNNKQFYRFKIGDIFKNKSGESIEFSRLEKLNIVNSEYNEKQGFIYPCYSGVTKGNHIVGFSKKYNMNEKFIKISGVGSGAGDTTYVKERAHLLKNCYGISSYEFCNEYVALLLQKELKRFVQGTTMPSLQFGYIKNEYIEIPINHEELSIVIKKIIEYKQLSKQLLKQMKDYKLAILQQSEKAIRRWKETNQHDKYATFKIGDEFKAISGKGSYNTMLKEGLCSDTYNKEQGFIYPFYDASTKNNHIKGYCKIYNNKSKGIKFSRKGDAGSSTYNNYSNSFLGDDSFLLLGKNSNVYSSLILNSILPNYATGTAQKGLQFNAILDVEITLPTKQNELSTKIEQLNKWQIKVEETVKQMEEYIEGVLQSSLK